MLIVETIAKIRRAFFVQGKAIKALDQADAVERGADEHAGIIDDQPALDEKDRTSRPVINRALATIVRYDATQF
jgi:hypothetical protein